MYDPSHPFRPEPLQDLIDRLFPERPQAHG